MIYEIFEYLDYYDVYNGFCDLNKRFQYLVLYSSAPITINTPAVSKSKFQDYYRNIVIPNKHRINVLSLSNSLAVDIVLSSSRIISDFVRLETLILDNINMESLKKIFYELMLLPNLHSLVLNLAEYVQNLNDIFSNIFRLPKLKYGKITYRIRIDQDLSGVYFSRFHCSPIETIIINRINPVIFLRSART
ncbi:unnamed protein product [Rotaria sp. Silwood1]|nr:unnamed protein product [Rotaria sp. Silwood1]CAF4912915.1 unnamed protein product [Rotaria sp. Silwood1]